MPDVTTRRYYANFAPQQQFSTGITSGDLSLSVADSFAGWPVSFPFYAVINYGQADAEIIRIDSIVGTTATIGERGSDGSPAQSHSAGATLDACFIRKDMDEANAHSSATAHVHGVAGNVVGDTDEQTLTNKTLDSPSITGTPAFPAGFGLVPAGVVSPFAGVAVPSGWLACDGSTVSRTTYASLWAALHVSHAGSLVAGGTVGDWTATITLDSVASLKVNDTIYGPGLPAGGSAIKTIVGLVVTCVDSGSTNPFSNDSGTYTVAPYGIGDGSTTFDLPNTLGAFLRGENGALALPRGEAGGSATHSHPLSDSGQAKVAINAGSGNVGIHQVTITSWVDNALGNAAAGSSGGTHTNGAGLTGDTDSASSIPPYLALSFIIKT